MAKTKKAYFCRECGFEAPKWLGRCPSCGEWNTFTEEIIAKSSSSSVAVAATAMTTPPQRVSEIERSSHKRLDLHNAEVNRVLGGGLVPGSLVLLGGEPGIGKSTLSLQIALTNHSLKTLYVSGEESAEQIGMRAERLGIGNEECYIYSETSLENILTQMNEYRPDVVVIDSIQTIFTDTVDSSAGSVSQIRECAAALLKYAKTTGTSIFIIGHITKDGTIAGPKILEHIVDVVLQFEGDGNNIYRILRGIKNRFGATFEIGVFEMLDNGLRAVENPSEILLSHYERYCRRCFGRWYSSISYRGAGLGEQCCVWYTATKCYGLRPTPYGYVVGCAGEACGDEDVPEGCLFELCRRFPRGRPGIGFGDCVGRYIVILRPPHSRWCLLCWRDWSFGRGATCSTYRAARERGGTIGFSSYCSVGIPA